MKPSLVLVGGGGHCRACIDVLEQEGRYSIAGIVDRPEKLGQEIFGYEIFATDDDLPSLAERYHHFLITVGQIKNPYKRKSLFLSLKELQTVLPAVISPLAYVSVHAKIGEGTIVMHHAVVNAGAEIGRNCIINSKGLVDHDAIIFDHCHISTGAVINGGVRIGEGTFMGSNSTCRENVEIGENCLIGAGIFVSSSVPSGEKVTAGNGR